MKSHASSTWRSLRCDGTVFGRSHNGRRLQATLLLMLVCRCGLLSKETTLYGQVGVVNNRGAMDTALSVNGVLYGVQGTSAGVDLGIRHAF
jgi:hypothetical protein